MRTIENHRPKDLAKALGVSYRKILDAIRLGQLRVIQYGPRTRLIRGEDAARWVSSITK